MRHCYADNRAAVFKNENIFDFFIGGKRLKTLRPKVNKLSDVFGAEFGKRDGMLRGI